MAYYTNSYEKVCDDEGSYIKIYNECRTLSIHEIHGFLRSKIVSFVMNLQPYSKAIYIARHGESDFNVRGLVGGDSGLSQRGVEFSKALSEFLYSDELGEDQIEDLCIWTSTMRRARDTVGDIRLGLYFFVYLRTFPHNTIPNNPILSTYFLYIIIIN